MQKAPDLAPQFLGAPIAHRGYHDIAAGRPENSRAGILAAVEAGYGIEIDVQLTADEQAVVFHDYHLGRLTEASGAVRLRPLAELRAIALRHGAETIPTLDEVLALVAGRAALLVEIKDQDGQMGPDVGPLEARVAAHLKAYTGPVAMMSFNPNSVRAFGEMAPGIARGLVTSAYRPEDWKTLKPAVGARLAGIPDYDAVGASFISHKAGDLDAPRVAQLKSQGADVLCWTIRSPRAEAQARQIAQNITFENYAAAIPSLDGAASGPT